MSKARTRFVERLAIFKAATAEPAVRDLAITPTNSAHNSRAALLRNGLAVAAFAILEEFLKARVAEATASVVQQGIPFSQLPKKLQEAATKGALKAIQFQAELERRGGSDPVPLIRMHAGHIAGTAAHPFVISDFAFGRDKSNLNDEDIKEFLGAFLVKDGWAKIEHLASRAGLASPALKVAFQSAARRRHRAAHHGDASVPETDLAFFARDALALAIGFDALIGRATRLIAVQDQAMLSGSHEVTAADIKIRFVDPAGSLFRELREGSTRAIRRHADLQAAIAAATLNARPGHELVVVRDRSRTPTEWVATDV